MTTPAGRWPARGRRWRSSREPSATGGSHLVGHSLGAVVALPAAARHPARAHRLVAIGSPLHVDARIAAVLDRREALAGPAHARAPAAAVPGARVELIEGSGHTPQVERPVELARLVLGFLVGRRGRPRDPVHT